MMPVKQSKKSDEGTKVETDEFLVDSGVCSDDDETTASGRPFHT